MSLLNFVELDNYDLQAVSDVVSHWCDDHGVALDCKRGRGAMCVAMAGEKSPVALSEAINAASV